MDNEHIAEKDEKNDSLFVDKGDFIKIDFTGRVKPEEYIFDTTSKEVAQANGLYNPKINYGPVIVCVGSGMVLKGLDESLIGKELGFDGEIEISPQDAFGKKDPKLLKLIPTSKFKSYNVVPKPGLQVEVDGMIGFVKSSTGGRTIVDFNHPLSGKVLGYHVKIMNKVDDKKEQVSSVLTMKLNLKPDNYVVDVSENKCNIELKGLPDIPDEMSNAISKLIKEVVGFEEISFYQDKNKKENETKESDSEN